jgi:hypothetical protein
MEKHHVVKWALIVLVILLSLHMVEKYITQPSPLVEKTYPSNVQDTITGDKKYVYM